MSMQEEVCGRINDALDSFPDMPARGERGRGAAASKLFKEIPQTVRFWLEQDSGGVWRMPDATKIPKLCKILNVNILWLMTGEGTKRPDSVGDHEAVVLSNDTMTEVAAILAAGLGDFTKLEVSKQGELINKIYLLKVSGKMSDKEIIAALNSGTQDERATLTSLVQQGRHNAD